MGKLIWQTMKAAIPNAQVWGAKDGAVSYVISRDTGCRRDDRYYGRFAVSAQMAGSRRDDLGVYDTLEQAKAAADASRAESKRENGND